VADKPYEADKAKANEADKAKANEADKTIMANEAADADKADLADEADMVMRQSRPMWHPNKADVINKIIAADKVVKAD
jgi:hypothetical protein